MHQRPTLRLATSPDAATIQRDRALYERLPFGVLWLDALGSIEQYTPCANLPEGARPKNVLGHDLFDHVLGGTALSALRLAFMQGVQSGQFDRRLRHRLQLEHGPLEISILLVYRPQEHRTLVLIEPDAYAPPAAELSLRRAA